MSKALNIFFRIVLEKCRNVLETSELGSLCEKFPWSIHCHVVLSKCVDNEHINAAACIVDCSLAPSLRPARRLREELDARTAATA